MRWRTCSAAGPSAPWAGSGSSDPLERGQRLRQDLAAVDDERLAGHVAGLLAGEEEAGVADVLDRAEAALRDRCLHRAAVLLAHLGQALGLDVARQHRVD